VGASARINPLATDQTVLAVHETSIAAGTAIDAVGVAGCVVSLSSVERVVASPAPEAVVVLA
jgi:hypothetical protein